MPVCQHEGDVRCHTLAVRRVLCRALEHGHRQGRAGREVHGQVCGSRLEVSILWAQELKDVSCLLYAGVCPVVLFASILQECPESLNRVNSWCRLGKIAVYR